MIVIKYIVLGIMLFVTHLLAGLMTEPDLFWKSMFLVLLLSNAWDINDIERSLK